VHADVNATSYSEGQTLRNVRAA